MHASHLILVPDEPVPGKDVHVNVSVKPDLVVTGGTVGIQASLFGVAVPGGGKDYTICHVTKCPVTAGKNATGTLSYPRTCAGCAPLLAALPDGALEKDKFG